MYKDSKKLSYVSLSHREVGGTKSACLLVMAYIVMGGWRYFVVSPRGGDGTFYSEHNIDGMANTAKSNHINKEIILWEFE